MSEQQDEPSVTRGLKLIRFLRGHPPKPPIIPEAEKEIFAQQERAEAVKNSKVGIVAIGCFAAFLLLCCGSCSLWVKKPPESKFSWPRR
jgi:hypothetical protein